MIKHIVFFRFKENLNKDQRIDKAEQLRLIFHPLKSHPSVDDYRIGINVSESEDAWDMVIDSTFDSFASLEEYRVSSEHRSAIEKGKKFPKDKSVIDYEF